jgi:hypothetical protein
MMSALRELTGQEVRQTKKKNNNNNKMINS